MHAASAIAPSQASRLDSEEKPSAAHASPLQYRRAV
jgi:hypothetical protein